MELPFVAILRRVGVAEAVVGIVVGFGPVAPAGNRLGSSGLLITS